MHRLLWGFYLGIKLFIYGLAELKRSVATCENGCCLSFSFSCHMTPLFQDVESMSSVCSWKWHETKASFVTVLQLVPVFLMAVHQFSWRIHPYPWWIHWTLSYHSLGTSRIHSSTCSAMLDHLLKQNLFKYVVSSSCLCGYLYASIATDSNSGPLSVLSFKDSKFWTSHSLCTASKKKCYKDTLRPL